MAICIGTSSDNNNSQYADCMSILELQEITMIQIPVI